MGIFMSDEHFPIGQIVYLDTRFQIHILILVKSVNFECQLKFSLVSAFSLLIALFV